MTPEELRTWSPDLQPMILQALIELGFDQPTEIQALSLPTTLQGKSTLILAETGTGKTLSFLLPAITKLKMLEKMTGKRSQPCRPRVLIIVPTRELGEQVLSVAKKLCHHIKFVVEGFFGGVGTLSKQRKHLEAGCDIVIGTPMRLNRLAEKRMLMFGDVRAVAIDEADTMFTQGFEADLDKIIRAVNNASQKAADTYRQVMSLRLSSEDDAAKLQRSTPFSMGDDGMLQYILCAATIRHDAEKIVTKKLPNLKVVKTNLLHHIPSGIIQKFVEVKPSQQRDVLLDQVRFCLSKVQRESGAKASVVIFCNTRAGCSFVHEQLKEQGIPHASIHGDISEEERFLQMQLFVDGHLHILVCTDIAARGMDIPQIKAVINFDMPSSSIDYIHRIGRTGRAGGQGYAVSLVRPENKILAQRIDEAVRKKRSLERVTAAKESFAPIEKKVVSGRMTGGQKPSDSLRAKSKSGFKLKPSRHMWFEKGPDGKTRATPRWNA
uniref:RNA helicase n=1 Tax=Hanusia phi TaxID=3032 RepID=A0A7S0EFR9_9CRYP